MKNKTFIFLACFFLLLIIGIGGALMNFGKSTVKNGTLYVNDKEIISENVTIHKKEGYADLPFTEVLKALEFDVEWLDSNNANIVYDNEKYVLNLENISLVRQGNTHNLIGPAEGGRMQYKILDKELILDSTTINYVLYSIKRIRINIDYDKLIVYVTERDN